MRLIPKVILIFLVFGSCSPPHAERNYETGGLKKINIIDSNGFSETISNPDRLKQYENQNFMGPQPYRKVLLIYNRDEQGSIPSYIHSYHPNGMPSQYLEVVNNRAFGQYKEWHLNGVQKIQANIIGGEADVEFSSQKTWIFDCSNFVWDDEGRLEAQINYEKGQLEADSLYYHRNGQLWKKVPFHNNQIHGTFTVFNDDGSVLQTSEYVNGIQSGPLKRFWCDGSVSAEESYLNGLLLSGNYFDLNQRKISEIVDGNGFKAIFSIDGLAEMQEYRNGVQEGEVKVFTTEKDPLIIYHIKNSVKHGDEIEYYPKLNLKKEKIPKLSISWYEGNIQGTVKTWYENGNQESQREISNNEKNGLSTAWYRDGTVMMVEEYEVNKLLKGKYYKKGESKPVSEVDRGEGFVTLYDPDGNFVQKIKYSNGWPDNE